MAKRYVQMAHTRLTEFPKGTDLGILEKVVTESFEAIGQLGETFIYYATVEDVDFALSNEDITDGEKKALKVLRRLLVARKENFDLWIE